MGNNKQDYLGRSTMKGSPQKPLKFTLGEQALNKIANKAREELTPDLVALENRMKEKDADLQNQIDSFNEHGLSVSNEFGTNPHIGISQKTLTITVGRIINILGDILGKDFMNFKLTVEPHISYSEGVVDITVVADSSGSISNFDSIRVYVNDVLVRESGNVVRYITDIQVDRDSTIKVVGVILGKTIIKEEKVQVMLPFFMGSGYEYTDVIVPECQKELDGSLEGEYDIEVRKRREADEKIYVIIPISRKEEFRRCKMDMNGFEIPFNVTEEDAFIVCESLNTYKEGSYNLDIDINS